MKKTSLVPHVLISALLASGLAAGCSHLGKGRPIKQVEIFGMEFRSIGDTTLTTSGGVLTIRNIASGGGVVINTGGASGIALTTKPASLLSSPALAFLGRHNIDGRKVKTGVREVVEGDLVRATADFSQIGSEERKVLLLRDGNLVAEFINDGPWDVAMPIAATGYHTYVCSGQDQTLRYTWIPSTSGT